MTEKCALTCGHCKETSEVSTVRRILDRAAKVAAKSEAEEIVKKPLQNILTTRRVQSKTG
jgi:hypothetical protein